MTFACRRRRQATCPLAQVREFSAAGRPPAKSYVLFQPLSVGIMIGPTATIWDYPIDRYPIGGCPVSRVGSGTHWDVIENLQKPSAEPRRSGQNPPMP
jgi:hypothetical protein